MRNIVIIGLMLTLTACSGGGGSKLNPFNWFGGGSGGGGSQSSLAPRGGFDAEPEYRQLADQVTALSVERASAGIIISATALMPTQGWYNADLVRIPSDDASEAVFEFRVEGPLSAKAVGPARSREITAASFLSTQDAAGLRNVRVIGARNSRSARR